MTAFHPLREWLAAAAAHGAARLAEAYAAFKESQGRLSFDDFVRQAARLLREPALAERIRNLNYSVLLDEAQDTNPAQFALLVGVTQPAGAAGLWVEGAGAPPAPGRFSMVGDPQQCIFDRADVRAYLDLHRRLIESGAAEALTFSVTMRCDEEIVASVNAVFPALLDARAGQAKFVPLQARPAAGRGGVWRLMVARPEVWDEKKVAEHSRVEAARLAAWLAAAGPVGVGAEDWSQVAILSPRKTADWLGALVAALKKEGLSVQLHSGDSASSDNPARVWLGALLGVLADPADAFETIGVLREIFGISDDEIFHWRQGNVGAAGRVAATVALLEKTSRAVAGKPLREAVALAVEAVQLRARLAALSVPPSDYEAMLDLATLADARGDTLGDFARELRRGPVETTEPIAQRGALQVMSSHKAKGLEWPVVILFGMFRKPGFDDSHFPRWLPPEEKGEAAICLYDKFHGAVAAIADGSWKTAIAAKRRAEFERLLYVSTTRPKQTLIAVDASALGAMEHSLGDILGVLPGGSAHAWWKELPILDCFIEGEEMSAAKSAPVEMAASTGWPQAEFSPVSLAAARARAENFSRRVRPSTLARHEKIIAAPERNEPDLFAPPDYPEEQTPPSAAVSYGNWWHALMENTPWSSGPKAWAAHWATQFDRAPDPARARAETARLLASPLAAKLASPGLEFLVEMPFLWPEPGGARAFDGCVDLAAWAAAAGRWLVVDWKTDRTNADAGAELLQRYGAQLEVYARTLAAVYAAPVTAFLYGTRTGVLAEL
jgi:ATP-dependent helicase/nuclease subunit A